MNYSLEPNLDACSSMANFYEKQIFPERRLSVREVKLICRLLDEISHYTPAERQQMIQQRAVAQERKEYSHPYSYYIAKIEYPEKDGTLYEATVICRDNRFYKTFLDPADNWFKAIPNAVIVGKSEATADYNEIVRYYNKLVAKNKQ